MKSTVMYGVWGTDSQKSLQEGSRKQWQKGS